jgi:aryl-alcohol dehydrogenase-like predicted oxidoreductase
MRLQAMTELHAHVWGPQHDGATFACVRKALELGINFFDTAEM